MGRQSFMGEQLLKIVLPVQNPSLLKLPPIRIIMTDDPLGIVAGI